MKYLMIAIVFFALGYVCKDCKDSFLDMGRIQIGNTQHTAPATKHSSNIETHTDKGEWL